MVTQLPVNPLDRDLAKLARGPRYLGAFNLDPLPAGNDGALWTRKDLTPNELRTYIDGEVVVLGSSGGGVQGSAGPQGPQGDPGEVGEAGPAGPVGEGTLPFYLADGSPGFITIAGGMLDFYLADGSPAPIAMV